MNHASADKTFELALPDYAITALEALEQAGFEAWLVGGCVRDTLLGRPINDYDIATSARWEDAEHALVSGGFDVRRTGVKHGTVTAVLGGNAVEVTTYRVEGPYSDNRHPDNVEFVGSIAQDLARRDFTINALAYHPARGLLDCWGGADDLRAKTIRVVGDAHERFSEDALRILRGCRFCSQLGFSIALDTLQAMKSHKMRLLSVSAERITHELQEMLLGEHVHDALLECVDVLGAVMPELSACKGFDQHTPYHIYDVLEHTAWVVQHVPATPLARWSALFHDIGKPGAFFMDGDRGHFYGHPRLSEILARGIMARLRLSPRLEKDILALVALHDKVIPAQKRNVRRALLHMNGNAELFRALCHLKRADALAQSPLSEPRVQLSADLERVLDEVLLEEVAFTVRQLAINGSDVMNLGIAEGPAIGAALERALDAVIDERVPNEREALLEFLQSE